MILSHEETTLLRAHLLAIAAEAEKLPASDPAAAVAARARDAIRLLDASEAAAEAKRRAARSEREGYKGSPHVTLRVKPDLLAAAEDAVSRANYRATTKRLPQPYTLRSWIITAMTDKLRHLKRAQRQRAAGSRKPKGRRRGAQSVCDGPAAACAEVVASDGVARNPPAGEPTPAAA